MGRVYEKFLKYWCTCLSSEKEHLQEELSHWVELLANKQPPWIAIWLTTASCLVYLDKEPEVFPVCIWGSIRRLLAQCVLLVTGATATEACSNINPCSGIGYVISGSVNAILD